MNNIHTSVGIDDINTELGLWNRGCLDKRCTEMGFIKTDSRTNEQWAVKISNVRHWRNAWMCVMSCGGVDEEAMQGLWLLYWKIQRDHMGQSVEGRVSWFWMFSEV